MSASKVNRVAASRLLLSCRLRAALLQVATHRTVWRLAGTCIASSGLPDYGLGDLSKIYRHMPASAHTLRREIEGTLLKYEPRLKSIDIAPVDPEDGMLLSFTMTCELHQGGLVRYGTYFTPEGQARLTTQDNTRD